MFKIGDEIKIIKGALYTNGNVVPEQNLNTKMYVRNKNNDNYVIGRAMTGPVLGEINIQFLKSIFENDAMIKPYIVQINTNNFPFYHSPSKNSGVVRRVDGGTLFTIVDERGNFGKVKLGAGWIDLTKVTKL